MKKNIYLDNAATTPVSPSVAARINDEMLDDFGNASSQHYFGRKARAAVEVARKIIADSINAKANEIVFTSGGTESNNTAIYGIAKLRSHLGKKIITTKVEHPSVLNPMKDLESKGYNIVYLDVDQTGHISLEQLKDELTDDTILVSIMSVNNEVGSIMPIEEIGKLVKDTNALFHVDDVQGFGNIDIDVQKSNIDLMSTSA
ncbi:MAG: aminotransferase class V-fold PLP-dependent enzyme, partial [Lactobacillus iners]|nr:aminotransferase class V-fold PLP-dependent enzyme [Lactobacillus iners]